MTPGIGIWIPRRGGHSSVSAALGGGGASLKASLNLNNIDTWWDADGGSFADGTGPFEFADNDHTMEGWFKVTETLGAEKQLIGSNDDVTNTKITVSSGDIWKRVGGEWAANAGGAPTINTWIHIASAWDASAGTAYIMSPSQSDVAWTTRGTTPQSNPANFFGFRIGDWGAGNGYTCKYAEIRIWNGIRTAAEITGNYLKCISPSASGLVALYASANANTAGVTTVYDEAGANNMTRQNGTNGAWDINDKPF